MYETCFRREICGDAYAETEIDLPVRLLSSYCTIVAASAYALTPRTVGVGWCDNDAGVAFVSGHSPLETCSLKLEELICCAYRAETNGTYNMRQ